ncbi:MAG: radical SAM protein [Desulfobacteraceae bacterium]|nr:radical SAM protein [Desulfobacteraceae bacterium]
MDSRTTIYPIFLPHAGCPFQCVYCNQNVVTGQATEGASTKQLAESIRNLAEQAERHSRPGEIAFYGGTFTALPENTMVGLLTAAAAHVSAGRFSGIRFSTRPDCLTAEVCALLSRYPVQTVELGVQSLSGDVLVRSRRGYSADCVREAAKRTREGGWSLGIQLMPGLPGDAPDRFRMTVAGTVALRPDFVRLYPTVVLSGTVLAEWFRKGEYIPLSLDDAVSWCAGACGTFVAAGIRIARMGLHADPELCKSGSIVAGPFHPAFGYLVRVRRWRDRVDACLRDTMKRGTKHVALTVPAAAISEVVGPGRSNVTYWKEKWRIGTLSVKGSPALSWECLECSFEEPPQSGNCIAERTNT